MGFNVFIVTGPRRSGKSALISCLVEEICSSPPHYIRLATVDGSKRAPSSCRKAAVDCGVVTATWVDYEPVRIFETLSDAVSAVQRLDPTACVIIEADTDPNLRHAYPYDCQVFTMPSPCDVHEIFRTPRQAQEALQSALHDTAAFAREIFGLFAAEDPGSDELHEQRSEMSDSQIIRLLHTPLGQELASRIQCQPDYHGIVESDVVVVNTGVGGTTVTLDVVVRRLEKLVRCTSPGARHPQIFCCDIRDPDDPRRQCLFEHFRGRYEGRR